MSFLKSGSLRLSTTRGRLAAVFAAGATVLGGGYAQAADLNILQLGDSLTYGLGATGNSDNDLGYRLTLQQFLFNDGVDYDMLGGFGPGVVSPDDPSAPTYTGVTTISDGMGGMRTLDLDHFGWSGARADGSDTERALGSALRLANTHSAVDFQNGAGQDVNPYGGLVGDMTQVAPNVIFLHIGTNSINNIGDNEYDNSTSAPARMDDLLQTLEDELTAGRIAADARIVIADIIPRMRNNFEPDDIDPGDFDLVNEVFLYNAQVDGLIAERGAAFQARVDRVSMFEIEVTQDLLDALGLADDSLINIDGDIYVDWVTGTYNENTNTGTVTGVNLDLFNDDGIHLTQLGYDIMAYQWYQSIPEPGSLALLGVGGLALIARRRR